MIIFASNIFEKNLFCLQVAAFFFVQDQHWFVEFDHENPCYNGTIAQENFIHQGLDSDCDAEEYHVASYENYAVFSLSQYQYIILIFVFAKVTAPLENYILDQTISGSSLQRKYLQERPPGGGHHSPGGVQCVPHPVA